MKAITFSSIPSVLLILSGVSHVKAAPAPATKEGYAATGVNWDACCDTSSVWTSFVDAKDKSIKWGFMTCRWETFESLSSYTLIRPGLVRWR
ncbi:predicted protein [Pyrenophora tritici-repentis Pt-1C-BFP]|uniref:Uncharacterized protein n=1 Tax=Pyrenophora tritici-repentis (strain Pt-1C-BFP) TaxID=426418 RepID=B2VV35_PYRTR|nr:uncharacterized protein PTRG_02218 [Pyrenophora tritici-repentis Pt-1C-BFP]EDU41656.1 predicted protein [Pyrenophora tritici-repentis Pt-1C-BFP]